MNDLWKPFEWCVCIICTPMPAVHLDFWSVECWGVFRPMCVFLDVEQKHVAPCSGVYLNVLSWKRTPEACSHLYLFCCSWLLICTAESWRDCTDNLNIPLVPQNYSVCYISLSPLSLRWVWLHTPDSIRQASAQDYNILSNNITEHTHLDRLHFSTPMAEDILCNV